MKERHHSSAAFSSPGQYFGTNSRSSVRGAYGIRTTKQMATRSVWQKSRREEVGRQIPKFLAPTVTLFNEIQLRIKSNLSDFLK